MNIFTRWQGANRLSPMRAFPFLTLPLALFAASCMGAITKHFVKSSPVPNWIYLHPEPATGDFARHRTAQGPIVQYEVHSVTQDLIEISQRFITDSILTGGGLSGWEYRLFVDRRGYVQEAYLLEDDGDKTRLRTARAGDVGFVANVENFNLPASDVMEVEAGTFQLSHIRTHSMKAAGAGEITVIHYSTDRVPFGAVKVQGYQDTEVNLKDLAYRLRDPVQGLALYVVLDLVENKSTTIEAELIEYGFAER